MRIFVGTTTDVVVILVFITLGANLPWGDIWSNLAPALAVVAGLILLARPVTVLLCLDPIGAAAGLARRSSSSPGRARPVSSQLRSRESWSVWACRTRS